MTQVPPLHRARDLLRRLGLHARKSLGQHFLVDAQVLGQIVAAAELDANDVVIEVGPGLGVLTWELASRAGRVVAVELDAELASALREIFRERPAVSIVNADILDLQPQELLRGAVGNRDTALPPYKVVANLPYYVTSPVLRHFLEAEHSPSLMVVMVQEEVGQRIAASPGRMSLLSVAVQLYGHPQVVFRVPPQSFYPPPKVSSVVLRIHVYDRPAVAVADTDHFFGVVRAGFSARRKQLRNALALGLDIAPAEVEERLREVGIEPRRRAQTLSLEEWGRLAEAFPLDSFAAA